MTQEDKQILINKIEECAELNLKGKRLYMWLIFLLLKIILKPDRYESKN
jgi:hypothetical protein